MKFTAIVPLKANSRRVPRKNFRLLVGKPLFVHIIWSSKGTSSNVSKIWTNNGFWISG